MLKITMKDGENWKEGDDVVIVVAYEALPEIPELDPSFYGLTEADLDQVYAATNTYFTKADTMTLRDMLKALRDTYSRNIGVEFMHITNPAIKRW